MPIIQSARKKLRQDIKRTSRNKRTKQAYKEAVKKAREQGSKKAIQTAYTALDTAVKKNIIHKNKAARLKHQVAIHVNR